jgi:Mn2+/Fe2+ NRAMP family transporter
MATASRRALVAALFGALGATVGIAGAGHVYLRQWRRAIAWFVTGIGAFFVLVSLFVGDPTEVTVASLPLTVSIPFAVVLLLSTVDAYRLATVTERRQSRTEGPTCPHCGKSIDEELAFCQWCTEPLDGQGG